MSAQKTIGIFGGSFNPIHIGHVQFAIKIQSYFKFDQFYIVPNKTPIDKPKPQVSDEDRFQMVQLAFEEHATKNGFEVSRLELDRNGPSYSLTTIETIYRQNPHAEIFFILGADAFSRIHQWYAFPDVLESCHFIVAYRSGYTNEQLSSFVKRLEKSNLLKKINPLQSLGQNIEIVQEAYLMRTNKQLLLIELQLPEISSTEIRLRLQMGLNVDAYLPAKARQYLKDKQLYVNTPSS